MKGYAKEPLVSDFSSACTSVWLANRRSCRRSSLSSGSTWRRYWGAVSEVSLPDVRARA